MKIALIGATGKAGRLIGKEATKRGYEVTAITRPASIGKLEENYPVIPKDIFELTTDDLKGFDIVVDAFGTDFSKPGNEYLHQTTMEHLIKVMEPLPEVRFFVVGGAGSLFKDESRTERVYESMSPAIRAVPENQFAAWNKLKDSKVNYTFMSPAETFDFAGPRTGKYTIGTDVAIKNSVGLSYITYADYAVAMVDEFENKNFVKTRFTAVSEAKYKNDGKNFFSIGGNPFTRRGSYFGIFSEMGGFGYGGMRLYIGSRRGEAGLNPTNKMIDIAPIHHGVKVPFAVMTKPDELILRTQYGNLRCCMPETGLLYIKGENGLGIRLDKLMDRHEVMKPRGDRAWEGLFRPIGSLVFNPLVGHIDMDAKWDWERLCTPIVKGDVLPDENGDMLLSIEEFTHAGLVRDSYPSYEEGRAAVQADWEEFLSHQPDLGPQYEDERRESAYMTWSHIVDPAGKIKRPFMYMMNKSCASSWQMCENAVALKHNLPIAIELMLNMIDQQSPYGQLPDLYDNIKGSFMMYKPPVQGWALKALMAEHDFATEVPRDKLEMMYDGYCRWADWFFKYRDDDHDGLPQYEHGDETGIDDSAVFRERYDIELPDLSSFLALLDESLGDLAKILGRDDEAEFHYQRSKELIDKLVKAFWNGERFIGLTNGDHNPVTTSSIMFYRPLVLGKRLPEKIIKKMAADLDREGDYLSPYGLLSVRLGSMDYNKASFGNASVSATENLLILTGLYDAGEKELARKIARRFCDGMKMGGSSYYGVRAGFTGSWSASGFQILADLAING